jgi:hypothetical protein
MCPLRTSDSPYHSLGSGQAVLHCAHRTSTASSCAFCEQEGWAGYSRLSPPSSLVISQGWGLIDLLLRAAFSPALPSDCFAIEFPGRAISQGEGLPILFTSLQGSGQGCPLLRASNEHRFTVRVLRARGAPGRSLPILRRPRVARAQKLNSLHPPTFPRCELPLCQLIQGSGWLIVRDASPARR